MEPVDLIADRDAWSAQDCSMDAALGVVGTRSALLLLREAFYGTRRFDDFVRRTGLTEAVTAGRLRGLVENGLLERRPYREQGKRERLEYWLTQKGKETLPVVVALRQWGDRWLAPRGTGPIEMVHQGCDEPVTAVLECAAGHRPAPRDLRIAASGGSDVHLAMP